MRVFKVNSYRLTKKDSLTSIFSKAEEVANKLNPSEFSKRFLFHDSGIGKISATKRAVKKYPALKAFQYSGAGSFGDYLALSNLAENESVWFNPHGVRDDIEMEILEGIANGIPRSFPFFGATFIFDNINWYQTPDNGKVKETAHDQSAPSCLRNLSPSIIFESDWGMSGRRLGLWSVIELIIPDNANNPLSGPDESVCNLIKSLGKIHVEKLHVVPSSEEKAAINLLDEKAEKVISDFKNRIGSIITDISLPHPDLKQEFPQIIDMASMESLKLKNKLVTEFKPKGFKYFSKRSGNGCYELRKLTDDNNLISLSFDLAPLARRFSWQVSIQGALWQKTIDLELAPLTQNDFALSDQETLNKLVENSREVIEYLEKTLIVQIENIYGPAPPWFEYEK